MSVLLAVMAGFHLTKAAEAATPARPVLPEWLAGCWVSETKEEWTEECWTPARGGVMLGSNRGGKASEPDAVANWEMMQIGPASPDAPPAERGLAFRASLNGSPWTAFEASVDPAGGIVFTNAAHDYPQRIRYWREGETLMAEIALADGSKPVRWLFRRAQSKAE